MRLGPPAVLLALASLGVSSGAHAAEAQTFEAIGRAPISAGDRVRARQRAFDEALQHVIEAAVGALLGPDALTRRAADLRLKILPRAKSYVTTYRVIEEGELEPGVFLVRIGAEVAADRLLRELADKRPTAPPAPLATATKVALCFTSEPAGPRPARLEAALRTQLGARGVELASVECGAEPAQAARTVGARAVLIAHLAPGRSEPVRGTALVGREVKLALTVVDGDGKHTAAGHGDGAGYGKSADDASDDAATIALTEAFPAIEAAFGGSGGGKTGGVTARLVGVRKFSQLTSLRTAIERLPGVEAVEPRRFLPGLPGGIELLVRGSTSSRALADGLARVAAAYQLRARDNEGQLVVEMLDPMDGAAAPSPERPQ